MEIKIQWRNFQFWLSYLSPFDSNQICFVKMPILKPKLLKKTFFICYSDRKNRSNMKKFLMENLIFCAVQLITETVKN